MAEKNQKRQDILKAARVLFMDKGFHNTKMEDIALAAGVGKGTLYEYFKNKQDIFDEGCIEYVDKMIEGLRTISSMDKGFKEKLLILFNEKLKMESEIADMTLDNILSSKNIISEKTVKTIIEKIGEVYRIIANIIDRGKEEGLVIKNVQSEILACMLVGTMNEYFRLRLFKRECEIKEDDVIFDLLFNGFGTSKTKRREK